jgi:hypothetical protein
MTPGKKMIASLNWKGMRRKKWKRVLVLISVRG